jgi:DNA-binding winged helix-turn-helix (wHTH) protein
MRATFGEYVFDTATRELTCSGESRKLSSKAFDLLEVLITHAPRALTKDELYHHIWGERFVDEVNLPNLMSEVRSALRDSRKEPRFIKTIHGYGYAFAAELHFAAQEETQLLPTIFSLRWRKTEFALHFGQNVIGRDAKADVVLDSAAVSRRHARITITHEGATIEDLGSKNGTFVGERSLEGGTTSLHHGDEIRLGHLSLSFRAVSRAGSTVTAMSGT